MGRVIHIADWLAARGTPPTAPAGAALPVPKKAGARGDNGFEECDFCVHAETGLCEHCEDGELFTPEGDDAAQAPPLKEAA
jgi:hypothetical protein